MFRMTLGLSNIRKIVAILRPRINQSQESKSVYEAAKSPYPSAQHPTRRSIPKNLQNLQKGYDGLKQTTPAPPTFETSPAYQDSSAATQLQNFSKRRTFTHGCGSPNSASQYVNNKPTASHSNEGNFSSSMKYAFSGSGGGANTSTNSGFQGARGNYKRNQKEPANNTYVSNYRADFDEMNADGPKTRNQMANSYSEPVVNYGAGARPQTSSASNYNIQGMQPSLQREQVPCRPDRPIVSELRRAYQGEMDNLKSEGLLKTERIITVAQNPRITFKGNQLRILNFCSNNYLGFASHPAILKHSRNILMQYGSGLSSVRHLCGTQDLHKDLEKLISKFHGREDALLYNSCYDANIGIFSALLSSNDAVFIDENSHVSLKQGAELSQAKQHFYKHLDVADLAKQLENSKASTKLIATDGVFSMDGDVAPLPQILDLADRHKAIVLLDDSHATGIFGDTGLGTEEYHNCVGRVDIVNSSLSKALSGAAGGYTVAPAEFIALLRQKSEPYLNSNSLPPAVVAAANFSLQFLLASNELQVKLKENTEQFRTSMQQFGFQLLGDNHPLCPVIVGDTQTTNTFADKIQWRGVYVMPVTYPLAPKESPRLRVQISAAHSSEDIKRAIEAFVFIGKMLKVIN